MKNKSFVTAAIVIALLMTSSALIFSATPIKSAQAQLSTTQLTVDIPVGVTPSSTVLTEAHLSASPKIVGIGQPILINVWLQPNLGTDKLLKYLTVTITKPSGTKVVYDQITTVTQDSTSWLAYVPDEIGEWKVEFTFPGNYFPAGRYSNGFIVTNTTGTLYSADCYYAPSTATPVDITVQADLVQSWPPAPLPIDYWTRPVHPNNREWWPILGNWPWTGPGGGSMWDALYPDTNIYSSNYLFNAYVQAPNSSHIVWKQQNELAGIFSAMTEQDTAWGTIDYFPNIILNGRCYQTITKNMWMLVNGTYRLLPTNVWECYDLRTGEVYWDNTGVGTQTPTVIEYALGPFGLGGGPTADLMYIGGGRLVKYDPYSGAVSANVSIAPLTTGTYYKNGYCLTVQNLGNTVPAAQRYRLINWTTSGSSATFASRIASNITWPWSSIGYVDYESNMAVTTISLTPAGSGVATNTRIEISNIVTGQLVQNFTVDKGFGTFSGSTNVADHGKFAQRYNDGYWYCWDMATGKQLWKGELTSEPWGTFGTYNMASYGGMIISSQYDGVAALDWDTGKVRWFYKWPTPFAFETPYTGPNGTSVYSFHVHCAVADGKLYIGCGEHTSTQPATRGWQWNCINITSGEGIWTITAGGSGLGDASRVFQGAIADGYAIYNDQYTGYMYVFGKGKSATTVTATDTTVPLGTAVLIKGTVLDESPAQPGTPCVSHDSMTTQMEYLHMQGPIAGLFGNATIAGVPVKLTAISPDGTTIDIGTATTNGYSGVFSATWTPTTQGKYEIIASFASDDSYGSSSATTAVSVGQAPEPYPEQAQIQVPDYTLPILGVGIAVIIAVAIATLLILRKRP